MVMITGEDTITTDSRGRGKKTIHIDGHPFPDSTKVRVFVGPTNLFRAFGYLYESSGEQYIKIFISHGLPNCNHKIYYLAADDSTVHSPTAKAVITTDGSFYYAITQDQVYRHAYLHQVLLWAKNNAGAGLYSFMSGKTYYLNGEVDFGQVPVLLDGNGSVLDLTGMNTVAFIFGTPSSITEPHQIAGIRNFHVRGNLSYTNAWLALAYNYVRGLLFSDLRVESMPNLIHLHGPCFSTEIRNIVGQDITGKFVYMTTNPDKGWVGPNATKITNCEISNSSAYWGQGIGVSIHSDSASLGTYGVVISNNWLEGFDFVLELDHAHYPTISDNAMLAGKSTCIRLGAATRHIRIMNNAFRAKNGIAIDVVAASYPLTITDNTLIANASSDNTTAFLGSSATSTVYIQGRIANNHAFLTLTSTSDPYYFAMIGNPPNIDTPVLNISYSPITNNRLRIETDQTLHPGTAFIRLADSYYNPISNNVINSAEIGLHGLHRSQIMGNQFIEVDSAYDHANHSLDENIIIGNYFYVQTGHEPSYADNDLAGYNKVRTF